MCQKYHISLTIILIFLSFSAQAESLENQADPQMNNQVMGKLIKRLDKKAEGKPGFWAFTVQGIKLRVITDERANRMRIISPIVKSAELNKDQLYRLMQANFDSALDARYSIAKGAVWSTYLHPLSELSAEEFITAVGQVVNLVSTYGSSFSSGLLIYQGGDRKDRERRNLIDKLLKKGLTV